MKTLKFLCCFLALSALTFYSCSDSDAVQQTPQPQTQNSVAMRTALNEIKKSNDIGGRPASAAGKTAAVNPFCFNFVYPLTFSFSNGNTITVTTFEGLLAILENETTNLYLEGISFPFQVMYGGAVHTISSENDFGTLITGCGFHSFVLDLMQTYCFDVVYPVSLTVAGNVVTFNSELEMQAYFQNPSTVYNVVPVFPITVNYQNQLVAIHSIYEFYEMVNNCDTGCICELEYAPVCVQTTTGTVQFGNSCFAACAGYTIADFVSCDTGNPVTGIYNTSVAVGNCNAGNATYQIVLDFETVNISPNQSFVVTSNNTTTLGTYSLSSLPVTINVPFDVPGNTVASATITIPGTNIIGYAQWAIPSCNCVCTNDFAPVCVQTATGTIQYTNQCHAICAGYSESQFVTCNTTGSNFGTQLGSCFTISYPLSVQYQGALVPVNSNSELLQYWFPAQGSVPAFSYPISVTFANSVYTVHSKTEFEALIAANCN